MVLENLWIELNNNHHMQYQSLFLRIIKKKKKTWITLQNFS